MRTKAPTCPDCGGAIPLGSQHYAKQKGIQIRLCSAECKQKRTDAQPAPKGVTLKGKDKVHTPTGAHVCPDSPTGAHHSDVVIERVDGKAQSLETCRFCGREKRGPVVIPWSFSDRDAAAA